MKPAKILIVEDEVIIAMELEDQLEHAGHQVVGRARTAEHVMAAVRQQLPDVALMDINLSGTRDGIDLACELRRVHDVAIVFVTAQVDDATRARAAAADPAAFLEKPFVDADLQRAIHAALAQKRSS